MRKKTITVFFAMTFVLFCNDGFTAENLDKSINGIYLSDHKSTEKALGKGLLERHNWMWELPGPFIRLDLFNSSKSEIISLIFHPGDVKNSFNEIRVYKSNGSRHEHYEVLKKTTAFVTGKGIKLGIFKNKLIEILGKDFKENIKDNIVILTYNPVPDKYPLYYGEYIFENERLIEYSFGYEYP